MAAEFGLIALNVSALDLTIAGPATEGRFTVHDEIEGPGEHSEASVVSSDQTVRELRTRFAVDFFDEEDIANHRRLVATRSDKPRGVGRGTISVRRAL